MKLTPIVPIILTIIFISTGCDGKKENQHSKSSDTLNNSPVTRENDQVEQNCLRGTPEPVLDHTVYTDAIFKISNDSLTAVEIVKLDEHLKLAIRHWGCEYYVLTFRFETNKYQAELNDKRFWFAKGIEFMWEIKGLSTPLDIEGGNSSAAQYIKDSTEESLRHITYHQDMMEDFIELERVEKLNDNWYAVEITFAKGPL